MPEFDNWRAPFRKPRKISNTGKMVRIEAEISEDEFDMLRAYGEGFSMLELSGAYMCHKRTVLMTMRDVLKRITAGRMS